MRRVIRLVIALSAGAGSLVFARQPAPNPVGSGSIALQVVDEATGRPVGGLEVDLSPTSYTSGPNQPRQLFALTAENGRYEFRDVQAAAYRATATKGNLTGTLGSSRPNGPGVTISLVAGQHLDGLVIVLRRRASVSGRVVDERGRAMAQAPVRLVGVVDGVQGLAPAGVEPSGNTDDRGDYRVFADPGRYVALVALNLITSDPSAFTGMIKFDPSYEIVPRSVRDSGGVFAEYLSAPPLPPSSDGKHYAYVPTFAPGVRSASDAKVVSVKPSEDVTGVDIAMTPARTFRVSGRVTGGNDPDAVVHIRLLGAEPTLAVAAAGMRATSESLVIMNAPEGDYRLVA